MKSNNEDIDSMLGFKFGGSSASPISSDSGSEDEGALYEPSMNYTSAQEAFCYENLNNTSTIKYDGFFCFKEEEGSYIKLAYTAPDKTAANSNPNNVGWKIHISINYEQLGKAWDAILPLFIENKILATKLVKKGLPNENFQTGKEITLYAYQEGALNWQVFLSAVNAKLVENQIEPSARPQYNKEIKGSAYFSCRNDNDGYGNYKPDSAETAKPEHTPYDNINIGALYTFSNTEDSKRYSLSTKTLLHSGFFSESSAASVQEEAIESLQIKHAEQKKSSYNEENEKQNQDSSPSHNF